MESASRTNEINPGHLAECTSETNRGSNDASPCTAIGNCTEIVVTPRRKSSIAVLSPRLEIQTARHVDSWRAVSRLVLASYANHDAQFSQFKQAALFRMRRRAIARTYSQVRSYGVQIQSPLSAFVSLVRTLIGELQKAGSQSDPLTSVASCLVAKGLVVSLALNDAWHGVREASPTVLQEFQLYLSLTSAPALIQAGYFRFISGGRWSRLGLR